MLQQRDDRELLLKYLYNRGDEVLSLAESQFPNETRVIVNRLVELIKNGNMRESISSGQLLGLQKSWHEY
jgi:hypothetical protein